MVGGQMHVNWLEQMKNTESFISLILAFKWGDEYHGLSRGTYEKKHFITKLGNTNFKQLVEASYNCSQHHLFIFLGLCRLCSHFLECFPLNPALLIVSGKHTCSLNVRKIFFQIHFHWSPCFLKNIQ